MSGSAGQARKWTPEAGAWALARLGAAVEAAGDGVGPQRVEIAVDAGAPLAWWGAVPAGEVATYFAGRDAEEAVLGVGVARLASAEEAGRGPAGWRFFGGVGFAEGPAAAGFAAPAVEIGREGAQGWVAAQWWGEGPLARRRVLGLVARMAAAGPGRGGAVRGNRVRAVEARPGREAWERSVEAALAAIAAGEVDKVVLARQVELGLARPLAADGVVERMAAAEPRSFRFALRRGGRTFVGASPERLYARRGREVVSEAVAGTRRRAEAGAGEALLAADKDRREHAVVVEAVRGALTGVCVATTFDENPHVMELGRLVHLHSVVRGVLAEGVGDGALVGALHPTPAVCGWPQEAARGVIARLEGFARGAYAGPIGWVGREGAELAVGIRAVELVGRRAILTAGAGIVRGSDPAAEWGETEAKLAGVRAALGVEA